MANTKLGEKKITKVRVRGGNYKFRALRLNTGNFNWASEGLALKSKIINVVYNASNNELVRTNTLVKNTIVRVDAHPFKNYLARHYFGCKEEELDSFDYYEQLKKSEEGEQTKDKFSKRRRGPKLDHRVIDQIMKGQVLCCISSRPGQSGRADGYILEGKELEFY